MAIYHLSVKIHSRRSGKSVVAAAAYRAGQSLAEEHTGITHNYTRKEGVEYSQILAPAGAPAWVFDRSALWNAVEAIEKRKDAQLAREVEVGLPIELGNSEQEALLRDYVRHEFVAKGMVADFSIHRDDENNPHAHVLLTMRSVTKEGFGPKERSWNERAKLMQWRQGWEEVSNEHLARAGLAVRIDHRSLKEQGSSLEPGRKIGVSRERQVSAGLPFRIADRVEEQRQIARENGAKILLDPGIALKALTHGQATFSQRDIARYLHTRTEGAEQFQAALLKVTTSKELVSVGRDDRGAERFTSREMLALESELLEDAHALHERAGHGVASSRVESVRSQHVLNPEQAQAYEELTAKGDLKLLVGVAGSGKSRLLAAAREAWEAEGFTVKGAALSGIAAQNLSAASGIRSRTLASFEYSWRADRDPLTSKDILVIDEAGMVGTRQLARVLEVAHDARAKVVLVGDPEQLQAIEAGAPFRGMVARHGMAQLNQVQRQRHDWQREATQELAKGQTPQALERYASQGGIVQVATRELARKAMLARWAKESETHPTDSRLMLAYTRDDVRELNEAARALRQQRGELGREEEIQTARGLKAMAVNERIYFLRNEKSLGVRNGTIGTIEAIKDNIVQIRLDGDERRVAVDTRFYNDLDYGYAATVYKAQGTTVDRTYLLATAHYDRHASYVGLSRHRESATLFYAAEDFGAQPETGPQRQAVQARLVAALSRARPKELVHDYLDRDSATAPLPVKVPAQTDALDQRQPQPSPAPETEKKRGRFAGLKLNRRRSGLDGGKLSGLTPSNAQPLEAALDRYGRAWSDIARMQESELNVLAHQQVELQQAGVALDQLRPQATRDLETALIFEPGLARSWAMTPGPERTSRLIAGLEREERLRLHPEQAAVRVVAVWNELQAEHGTVRRGRQPPAMRERVEQRLRAVARHVKGEPALEQTLQANSRELGIDPRSPLSRVLHEKDPEHAQALSVPARDLGLSR